MSQTLKGKPRRITDAQIRVLQAWIPLKDLALAIGVDPKHAIAVRTGRYVSKEKAKEYVRGKQS